MRPVTVQFLKNPDHVHWGFETMWLGEDEWGSWMWVPVGSRRWKGSAEVAPTKDPAVFCSPDEGWWHLHYSGTATNYSHFVDIVTQPAWVDEHRYEMIDLDLDVVRTHDGSVMVEDEDEFLVHQVTYGYEPHMIERAKSETERIVAALTSRDEPFFETAATWLDRGIHGGPG